jgi:hypothetical protein
VVSDDRFRHDTRCHLSTIKPGIKIHAGRRGRYWRWFHLGGLDPSPTHTHLHVHGQEALPRLKRRFSPPLLDDNAVALVLVQEVETLDDPRIQAAAHVLRDFLNDVAPIL